jgi:glycosyltransferase involved in cell wall biosynthesis
VIRIAHLLPSLEIGGRERTVLDLCSVANSLGQRAAIITYDQVPDGRATFPAGEIEHFQLDRLRARDFDASLRALIDQQAFDIIHAHGQIPALYAARLPAGLTTRIATLHTALGGGWRWLMAIRRALRQMDCLTAVSDDVARRFGWWVGRDILTIPTGVDIARFSTAKFVRAAQPFTIGMVARLHKVKRHCDAIAAIKRMRDTGSNARLVIVGDGPLECALREQAMGVSGIEFLGPVADAAPLYAGFDAFLLCSDHEAMPVALLEAMAGEVPCLVSNVGGMRSFVSRGSVIGFEARRSDEIAQALLSLESSEPLRRRLSANARDHILQFSLTAQAQRYDALYRKLRR